MNPTVSLAIQALTDVSRFLLGSIDQVRPKGNKSANLSNYFASVRSGADQILAEKLANAARLSELSWQFDMLGQLNYGLHNHPDYFLSLFIRKKDKPYAALIYNPLTQNVYSAVIGLGAYANTKRIRLTKKPYSDQAIVSFDRTALLKYQPYKAFTCWTVTGSPMLDIVRLASGAVDGLVIAQLNTIQLNVARLLLQESGGLVELLEQTDTDADAPMHGLIAANQYFLARLKTVLCPL